MALPGVTTILKDQFYTVSRTDVPTGPRVCAIATRNTPAGTGGVLDFDPVAIHSEKDAITAFGFGSGLHRAYLEFVAGGATSISLVALPMGTTDLNLLDTTPGTNVFDKAFAAAEQAQPDIIVPWGRGGHPAEWFNWLTPGNPDFGATPSFVEQSAATPILTAPAFGFYADTTSVASVSLAYRVAAACAAITGRSNPCFAVMGVKPFVGTIGAGNATENIIASDLATYLNFTNLPNSADPGMGLFGPYLTVVATEVRPVTYPLDFGYSNGAGMFAAAASRLSSWSSPTGKTVTNVSALRWSPNRTQQDINISQRCMVPLALDYNRVPGWVDAPTFAAPTSDYARLTTIRIIFDAVQLVRQIALQYVGENASIQHRNAFETAISSGLRGMIQLGALNTADYVVSYQPRQNQATVDLVLTPAFEIRNIVISVSVNL